MKKILILIISLILIFPYKTFAINTSATSSILMDIDSHRILHSKNIHDRRSVASISKIMTAILAIESGKLDDKVIINNSIKEAYGSGIYIKVGEELTLRDLVYGLMLRSGNDAAIAISNYVSKDTSSFVELMNKKAKELGMKNTEFNNPSGLDEEKGNYSTAYDMALLMSYAYQNTEFRIITGTKKYSLKTNKNMYVWHNKNKLLNNYKYATGGKTGFTKKAKRTLVTTASKNNLNLVVVTLNDGDDWNDHKKLFEYGFNTYKKYHILDKNKFKIRNEKYYKKYKLYIKKNFDYPIEEGEQQNILIKISLKKVRKLKNNIKVGNAIIYLNNKKIHSESIYLKIKDKSLFKNITDWINNIW